MSYTGSTPDTEPAADWRRHGACSDHDEPDIWYATAASTQGRAEQREAQAICYGCPVIQACGQWALETREPWGTWGGMTEPQRRRVLRRRGIRPVDDEEPRPRTFQSLYDERTAPLTDGHLAWTGATPIHCDGAWHTPRQITFRLDRGRPAVGIVRRTCDRDECVLAAHLMDQEERDEARERAAREKATA